MKTNMSHRSPPPVDVRQHGFVLVVVLILLVVLSMLGLSSVRSTRFQEQIAGAQYERVTALAASHAGLSDGRDYVLRPDFDANISAFKVRDLIASGVIGTPAEGWTVSSWLLANTDWIGGPFALPFGIGNGEVYAIPRVHRQPAFVVDRLPSEQTQNAMPYQIYRITSRGEGARQENAVFTQSIVRMPVPN